MEKILYAELNMVCAAVCLLMLCNMIRRYGLGGSWEQRFFSMLIAADIIILLADGANWVLEGITSAEAFAVNEICSVIYCILNPGICFLWLLYADFRLHQDWDALRGRLRWYVIPAVVNTAAALASPWTEWLYLIDETNAYHRGQQMWIMTLCSVIYLIFPVVLTLGNLSKYGFIHERKLYWHLFMFPVLLSLALVVQLLHFGLSLIWAVTTLSILSVFISMQNADIVLDPLTGVYNRRHLDTRLHLKTRGWNTEDTLFLMMADIDDFKDINDQLGHVTGDDALVQAAELLQSCCHRTEDFIVRYGGDEFVILGKRSSKAEVEELRLQIENAAAEFNRMEKGSYVLSFSIGVSIYEPGLSAQDFLTAADRAMYNTKENKKAYEA